jgi:hypothetical protein
VDDGRLVDLLFVLYPVQFPLEALVFAAVSAKLEVT